MLIERDSSSSIFPEALEILSSGFSVPTYQSEYLKRPPLGIYNVSLNAIWKGFEYVLDELEKVLNQAHFHDAARYGWEMQLLRELEILLSAIHRHFDDCKTILKCFFPSSINRKQFESSMAVKSFIDSTQEYRSHAASIINHLKHHQGRLRAIFLFDDTLVIPGYFVEGVDEEDNICPFEKIHNLHKGKATAFSFSRDLKLHFYSIYEVSHHLRQSLSQIIGSNPQAPNIINGNQDYIVSIAQRIAKLPNLFYVDEQHMDAPSVRISTIGTNKKITLSYPDDSTIILSQNKRLKVWTSWIGDGVSKSYKLPYFDGL